MGLDSGGDGLDRWGDFLRDDPPHPALGAQGSEEEGSERAEASAAAEDKEGRPLTAAQIQAQRFSLQARAARLQGSGRGGGGRRFAKQLSPGVSCFCGAVPVPLSHAIYMLWECIDTPLLLHGWSRASRKEISVAA